MSVQKKFKSAGGFGLYLRSLKEIPQSDKMLLAYSILDMIFAKKDMDPKKNHEMSERLSKHIHFLIKAIVHSINHDNKVMQDSLKEEDIRRRIDLLLQNPSYCMQVKKEFTDMFISEKEIN